MGRLDVHTRSPEDEALKKKAYKETQETVSAALREKKPVHLARADSSKAKSLRDLGTAERASYAGLGTRSGLQRESRPIANSLSFDHGES